MNLTTFIDIAIGLTLMYLAASLFVTTLNELIAQMLSLRGRQLVKGLAQVIDNPQTRQSLARIPTLAPLFGGGGSKPNYVDPALFANALLSTFDAAQAGVTTVDDVAAAIEKLPDSSMKRELLALARSATGGLHGFVQSVGTWVDTSLTMLGGAYKTWIRALSLALGLVVAVSFNLDTISVVTYLNRDAAARRTLAAAGSQFVEKIDADAFNKCITAGVATPTADCKVVHDLAIAVTHQEDSSLATLPIGWSTGPEISKENSCGGGVRFLGWILTALAISLGAPFWFDLLSKFVSVRNGMKKPLQETN